MYFKSIFTRIASILKQINMKLNGLWLRSDPKLDGLYQSHEFHKFECAFFLAQCINRVCLVFLWNKVIIYVRTYGLHIITATVWEFRWDKGVFSIVYCQNAVADKQPILLFVLELNGWIWLHFMEIKWRNWWNIYIAR